MKKYHGFLKIPEERAGEFSIKHVNVPAGKPLFTATMRNALIGGQKSNKIIYDYETTWHQLCEADGVWMTDLPVEQTQANNLMRGIHGHVLVTGLGLGYVAQRLALRRSVQSVTVIEKQPEVIHLVFTHLRGRSKMRVHRADAFDYLEQTKKKFDYVYHDIWQSDGETTFFDTVVPLRKLTSRVVSQSSNGYVRCWNEDVMRGQLMMALISRLTFAINPVKGSLTFEELCEPIGNKYQDWSVEFFRWARNGGAYTNAAEETRFYANTYGLPGWLDAWKTLIAK